MRIDAIDMARGYTVLVMPMIHTVVIYGNDAVQQSVFATVLAFFAEETGAPLFMFLMGMSAGLKTDASCSLFLKRSVLLMVLAFLLNLLKFAPLFLSGKMPQSLLFDLGVSNDSTALVNLFFMGDILHLASLSFLTFALCVLAGKRQWMIEISLLITVAILASMPLDLAWLPAWIDGAPPQGFFPLLPWFFYALAGKLLCLFIKKRADPFLLFAVTGTFLVLAVVLYTGFIPHKSLAAFYKPTTAALVYYTACSMIWIFVCAQFAKTNLLPRLKQLLRYLSSNITVVYFMQWILIFLGVAVADYRQQGMFTTLLLAILMSLLTVLLTCLYTGIVKLTTANL